MLRIEANKATARIEEYLEEIDTLSNVPYAEGIDKKNQLNSKIANFVQIAFSDGKEKSETYERSFAKVFFISTNQSKEQAERREQEDYSADLKTMRQYLIAYKDEILQSVDLTKSTSRLDEIRADTQEAQAESDRRRAVADSKVYGGFIEVIDTLRGELKRRSETENSIAEIKNELIQIKKMLADNASSSLDKGTTTATRDQFYNLLYIEIGRINEAFENETLPYRRYSTEEWEKFKEDSRFRQMDGKLRADLSKFYDALARISELSRRLIRIAEEALLDSVREDFGEDVQMCMWQIVGYNKSVAQGNLPLQSVEAIINGRNLIEHASMLYPNLDAYKIQVGLQSKSSNEVPWRDINVDQMKAIFTRAIRTTAESGTAKEAREQESWVKQEGPKLHEELGRILDKSFRA
jgi:uncharacterized protein YdcH (DUF465 family)